MLTDRLAWLREDKTGALLRSGLRGIEKETLRVDEQGRISVRPHPEALGSALTHPNITTDYSEALLELVTPPLASNWQLLQNLCETHAFVHRHLSGELLWPMSMPCVINANENIPIADYGTSNLGMLKTVYRRGLGHRYGRGMQAIAGVHFNYSPPLEFWPVYYEHCNANNDSRRFKSEALMGLVRNYRRHAWIVVYLFGASPAFCKSFRPEGHALVEELNSSTWYAPFATSLRMSDLGYRNKTQARLSISVNSLDEYVGALIAAVTTTEPAYQDIGIVVNSEYRQLNANLLQIENEYYSSIRPKPAKGRKRTAAALRDDGVEYVEVRSLDLSPADPVGINQSQLRVLETLLVYCLLQSSPPIAAAEQQEIDARDLLVAREGRRPGLKMPFANRLDSIAGHGDRACDELAAIAELLDGERQEYTASIEEHRAAFADAERTPSARVLADLSAAGNGFFDYSLEIARRHHEYFAALELDRDTLRQLEAVAAESLERTRELESDTSESFEQYLARFAAEV